MSPKLDSPVQTQMAVSVFKSPLANGEYSGTNRMEGKLAGRRRVFVQTETGCVLGMELERSDNAHTVKRRLQLALNFPTEESSLTFGDMVLKNDLSAIRNDSHLLLTRNLMHRSSSTPCLSPTARDIQQRDQSGPIEILGKSICYAKMKQLVKEIVKGINNGVDPLPVHSGLGGAYYFRNKRGENVAIVKPTDEEPFAPNNPKGFVGKALGQPGLKRSVRVGETGFREVAAYLLDYDHFANVPPTALVNITHSIFNVNDGVNGNKPQNKNLVSKIASFQQFIPHDFDASDHGTSSFPVAAVHRIGILDIRILNTDRHAGNLLVRKLDGFGRFGQVELIPIDHGLCLPECLEDPYFEWIHWPQASIPFSDDELEYIENLDPITDSEMLRSELPMIRDACLRVLVLCTIFLKAAAVNGLCLAEIGEMMSREFRRGDEEPSELEVVCIEAKRLVAEDMSPEARADVEEFQFDIDYEDGRSDFTPRMVSEDFMAGTPFPFGFGGISGRTALYKLEESIEEDEEEENEREDEEKEKEFVGVPIIERITTISNLSTSLKNTSLGESQKFTKFSGAKPDHGYLAGSSSGHRSANEQLPASVSFVKLADMNEEEWALFLEKFQELLYPAFEKRKSVTLGHRQRQRLGTSCQF
ncbi:phosphatidylinositol 4-kinase gamma 5-like [Olea europaea var. sylvestris]|uniref:phosphatidylinositol 4-kinase gamma 5-like n=1 Tax=Olea europaea var. sylvestris TaxID=158386 RepID=UPI000C1D5A64|nr:phosphatidylinositol 4-kinase gamma 5-like [Olea europaea var. sylvestris]XP_022881870.1 phosphatidylinositol 4-kinase gamma 5-like [Olea europaea var. sylvestris]